jgi:hypothetical protein
MILQIIRVDENVVQVHNNPAFGNLPLEDFVHHRLEGRGRISETEEHH